MHFSPRGQKTTPNSPWVTFEGVTFLGADFNSGLASPRSKFCERSPGSVQADPNPQRHQVRVRSPPLTPATIPLRQDPKAPKGAIHDSGPSSAPWNLRTQQSRNPKTVPHSHNNLPSSMQPLPSQDTNNKRIPHSLRQAVHPVATKGTSRPEVSRTTQLAPQGHLQTLK